MKKLLFTTLMLLCFGIAHAEDVTEVSTFEEFIAAVTDSKQSIKLTADMTLTADDKTLFQSWVEKQKIYFGDIDGDGHYIDGLTCDMSSTEGTATAVALIPLINDGSIRNLTLKNVSMKGKSYVGAFVGKNIRPDECYTTVNAKVTVADCFSGHKK